jgi:hypothetical protein
MATEELDEEEKGHGTDLDRVTPVPTDLCVQK